jgi:hypothetical protein
MPTLLSAPATRAHSDLHAIDSLGTAAAYLGLEPAELRAWLEHGGSLAGIARTLGRPPNGLFDVVVESARADLDPRLSVLEQDRLLADLRDRLTAGRNAALLRPAA